MTRVTSELVKIARMVVESADEIRMQISDQIGDGEGRVGVALRLGGGDRGEPAERLADLAAAQWNNLRFLALEENETLGFDADADAQVWHSVIEA